jgi:hypothetical protein
MQGLPSATMQSWCNTPSSGIRDHDLDVQFNVQKEKKNMAHYDKEGVD